MPCCFWPLALFGACFLMGIVAVPAGIVGGILFVPIFGGFFLFHLDFVRGAGLPAALASPLAAAPMRLRGGLASLRLALPLALLASAGLVGGALLALALPVSMVQTAIGVIVRAALPVALFVALFVALLALGRGATSSWLLAMAFAVRYVGLLVERWFFVSQARHPRNLFYPVVS